MPTPVTPSGARLLLQKAYQSPAATRSFTPRTASQARQIKALNRMGGFTANSPTRSVRQPLSLSPRPLQNTLGGRATINGAANAMNRAASRVNQAVPTSVKHRLPAPASVSRFLRTPTGGGVATAALGLGVAALDGEITGNEAAGAIGAGVGGAIGTALGSAAGPIGAFVGGAIGGYLGQALGQSLFPQREGPSGDYVGLEDVGFQGGQSHTAYNISGVFVSSSPPGSTPTSTPFNTTAMGPLSMESVPQENGTFRRMIDASGDTVVVLKVQNETQSASFENIDISRVDGQPDTGGNSPGVPVNNSGQPARVTPRTRANNPGTGLVPALAPLAIPALIPAPAQPPNTPAGPGPDKQTAPAFGRHARKARRPNATPRANPGGGASRNTPPPPTRTKTNKNCGCNKGILDGVKNLFANNATDAAQLGLLAKIDATTTANSAGIAANNAQGVTILTRLQQAQQFAEKAWQNTHIDKLINMLTLITVMHNGAMISRDIGETLGYVMSNALAAVGVKDEDGNALDINGLVGGSVTNFIKSVVGADVYDDVRTNWQKANRVLQSASNIVWTIRSINDTTQDVMEWTAENTGKIGNALKKWGVVGERAYPWMSERVKAQDFYRRKFSRVFDGLETVENTASSLAVVTSDVREIQEEVTELGEARTRFTDAVTAFGPEDTPGLDEENQLPTSAPENQPIKVAEDAAEGVSQSPNVAISTDAQRGDPPDDATP